MLKIAPPKDFSPLALLARHLPSLPPLLPRRGVLLAHPLRLFRHLDHHADEELAAAELLCELDARPFVWVAQAQSPYLFDGRFVEVVLFLVG